MNDQPEVDWVESRQRPTRPAPSSEPVVDLMAALRDSVDRARERARNAPVPPAPGSDTPSDERACVSCNGTGRTPSPTGMAQIGGMSCAGCFGTGKKENPIVLSNECSDPDPNGGAPCCRPLGHHVLTDHWNGQDEWPAQPAPSSVTPGDERHPRPAPSSSPVGDRGLELAGWLATCAADTLAYIEAGHRISHAEPVGDHCLADCTEAWYVERDTLRAAIADVRALLAAADRGEPTDA